MFCTKCGAENDDKAEKCVKCGEPLRTGPVVVAGTGVESMIPYKNVCALVGYYLAVFSLIPFIGILLGIPAFILGIMGLKHARQHPEAKGKVHAWVGIILGGLCGFGWLVLILIPIIAEVL